MYPTNIDRQRKQIGSVEAMHACCATRSAVENVLADEAANFSKLHTFRLQSLFSTVHNILASFSYTYGDIQFTCNNKFILVPWRSPSFSSWLMLI